MTAPARKELVSISGYPLDRDEQVHRALLNLATAINPEIDWTTVTRITCDECGVETQGAGTAQKALAAAQAAGWSREDDLDVCPECQTNERRPS